MGRSPTNTKHKLIETATDLIWRDSYGSVSVDEICTKAKVQKGSFYHYFPSKAHLALATMDWCMQKTKEQYDAIFNSTRAPRERFSLMVDALYQQQLDIQKQLGRVCGCPFATLGSELAAQDKEMAEKIVGICEKKIAYYEEALRDCVLCNEISSSINIKQKAEEIFAFIMGQLIMARIKNDLSFIEHHLKDALYDLIGMPLKKKA